jgi:hypothetical protein
MSNINRIIREVIKEFRSKLPDKEIEEYSGKLNKLHIYQCNKHIIENKKLYHYTIDLFRNSYRQLKIVNSCYKIES